VQNNRRWLWIVIALHIATGPVFAETFTARVADLLGSASQCERADEQTCPAIQIGDVLLQNTVIKTGPSSAVLLELPQNHVFRIGSQTTVQLKEIGENQSFSFGLIEGWIWSFVDKTVRPSKYEVETPSAVVGVTGTVFSAFHSRRTGITTLSTHEGTVEVRHSRGTVHVGGGSQTHVHSNEQHPVSVEKQDAEHREMWSLLRSHENWMKPNGASRLHPHMPRHLERLRQKLKYRTT